MTLLIKISVFTLMLIQHCKSSKSIKCEKLDLSRDVKELHDAMAGWGTNEDKLIDILSHRCYNDRLTIAREYTKKYDPDGVNDLWDDIKKETSGDFRASLKPLVMTEAQFFAEEMYYAMKGMGTDESSLINTLMLILASEHAVLEGVKNYYRELYDGELIERIPGDTNDEPTFRDFLIVMINRTDFSEERVNMSQVQEDYDDYLTNYIQDKQIDSIIGLFGARSIPHIKALREFYYNKESVELEVKLGEITGHHTKEAFSSFLALAADSIYYMADELRASMEGNGTDEELLLRIICTRADKDLALIKVKYQGITGRTLKNDVDDDTSGDFRKVLLNLIN